MGKKTKTDKLAKPNPQHVKDRLKAMLPHYKNVWSELARKLGIDPSKLSGMIHDRVAITQAFLDTVKEKTGVEIPLEPPGTKTLAKTPAEQVMAVVMAVDALDPDAEDLLDKLVNFRSGGEALSTLKFLRCVSDITLIKDVLVGE